MAIQYILDSVQYDGDSLIYKWWAAHDLYLAMALEDSIINEETVFANFVSAFELSSTFKLMAIGEEVSFLDTLDGTDYEWLVGRLNSISTDNDRDYNLKAFYRLHMDNLNAPDEEQYEEDLWELAELCAFEGGPAVLAARNILAADSIELLYYPWDSLCSASMKTVTEELTTDNSKMLIESERQPKLIPNFFGDNRIGMVSLGNSKSGRLMIFGIDGKLVGSFDLQGGNNILDLSKSLVQSGVYIYKIFVDGQLRTTDKLISIE